MTLHPRSLLSVRDVGRALATVRLPGYVLVSGTGVLLGLYLVEFLRFNLDFTGPQPLGLAHAAFLVLAAGPGFVCLLWLLSALLIRLVTDLTLRQALALDAQSYWPGFLIGLSLLLSVVLRRPVAAYHAAVVVLFSAIASLVLAFKAWLVEPLVVPAWRARLASPRLVAIVILLYLLVVGVLDGLHYEGYNIWGVDLGHWDQGLWNTWRGRPLQFTQYGGLEDSLLTDHVVLVAYLIAPLYLVWSDPRALLLLQAAALGLGAWLAYRLARRHLAGRFAALGVALAYLAHPMIVGNGLDASGSFRSDLLVIPLLLGFFLVLEGGHWVWTILLAILILACKERMAVLVFMLGLYVFCRYRRQRRLGLVLAGLGALWLVVVLGIFLPWLRGGQGSIHYQLNFGDVGGEGGLGGIASNLVSQPMLVATRLFSLPDILAVFFLLLSLALLPFGDVPLLLAGAPTLALFLFTGTANLADFHLAPVFVLCFVAAIFGIARAARWGHRRFDLASPRLVATLSILLLGASLSASFFWSSGPLSWGFWSSGRPYTFWQNRFVVDAHDLHADRLVSRVPENKPVIASDFLLARLTQRERVYHFFDPPPPEILDQIDYAAIDLFEVAISPRETSLRTLVGDAVSPASESLSLPHTSGKDLYRQLLEGGDLYLTVFEDGLLFLQREPAGTAGFQYAIEPVGDAMPVVRVGHDFGNRLRLLGYDLEETDLLVTGLRYRIHYYWQVLEGFDQPFLFQFGVNPVDDVQPLSTDYVLIDTFARPGVDPFHVVHLPTYLLMPPVEWQPGQVLREEIEFSLPSDLAAGDYAWHVGMYVVPRYFPIQASPERQVPGTEPFLIGDVEVIGTP